MSNPIRVLIADDHDLVRRGIAVYLYTAPQIELVGEAATGQQAVDKCQELLPDVILMDMIMPELSGLEAIDIIQHNHPQVQIIVLTSYDDEGLVQEALQAGAVGYLMKDVSMQTLIEAIEKAAKGEPTLSPQATRALIKNATKPSKPDFQLTTRELEVLRLLVEGYTNRVIAERLYVSPATVKFHVSAILSKLDANTRTEAAMIAKDHHLVDNIDIP